MARVRDYSKGLIYKIECNDPSITECYYGSTINFRNRKNQHKTNCCNEKRRSYNCKVYKFIREHGGWSNWDMVLVEYYPCNTKLELERHERTFVIKNINGLNKYNPARTNEDNKKYWKEYREKNKEKIKERDRLYHEVNKEKINEKQRVYHKLNREVNKEKINEKQRVYHEANKEKINERRRQLYHKKKNNI